MKIDSNGWKSALGRRPRPLAEQPAAAVPAPMRLGVALGGGFARGLAHIGVLGVLEQNGIPLDCITGVSAGAIVAAAYATFEQMRIPLGAVATDVITGQAVIFRDRGDVVLPIRASCSYPGQFQPVRCGERLLGATHLISLHLPMQGAAATNMFHVIN